MATTACSCGVTVQDGHNGTVYEAPPWADAGAASTAVCYDCENESELAAEDRRQEARVDAALRAGRADLV